MDGKSSSEDDNGDDGDSMKGEPNSPTRMRLGLEGILVIGGGVEAPLSLRCVTGEFNVSGLRRLLIDKLGEYGESGA